MCSIVMEFCLEVYDLILLKTDLYIKKDSAGYMGVGLDYYDTSECFPRAPLCRLTQPYASDQKVYLKRKSPLVGRIL